MTGFLIRPLPFLPLVWVVYRLTAALSEDPIAYLMTWTGYAAIGLLLATVWVTPLFRLTGVRLYRYRRYLGLWSFAYGLFHFLGYFLLEAEGSIGFIVKALDEKPFILLGSGALAILTLMAITSIPPLFRKYFKLHKLVDLALILLLFHIAMAQKSLSGLDWALTLAIGGTFLLRLGLAAIWKKRRSRNSHGSRVAG